MQLHRTVIVALALALAAAAPEAARAQSSLGPERRDLGDFAGDIWSVWSSPAHIGHRDVVPLAAAVGTVVLTARADSSIYAWMTAHPNSAPMRALRPLREGWKLPLYELGSGQYLLPISTLLYAAGRLSHDADLRDAGLGCAAGHLSSAGLRDLIYFSVSRDRPRVSPSADHVSFPGTKNWDKHSFLSGHVANSMACASFVSHRYELGLIEPAMYAYVTIIGLGRMADGRHWASDTMAGGIMGFAIGKAIADRQHARLARRSAESPVRLGRIGRRVPLFEWSIDF